MVRPHERVSCSCYKPYVSQEYLTTRESTCDAISSKVRGKNFKWIMVLIFQKEIDASRKRLEGSTKY